MEPNDSAHAYRRAVLGRFAAAGLGVLLWTSCAATPTSPTTAMSSPDAPGDPAPATVGTTESAIVIAFVRHAEKAATGGDDPPLTPEGQARAQCLVRTLDGFEPDVLLSTPYVRTKETLAPLQQATSLPVETLDASAGQAWTDKLRALPAGTHAVVSAHANTIPHWVRAFGGDPGTLDPEGNIEYDEYDRIIFVVLDAEGEHVTTIVHRYCTE